MPNVPETPNFEAIIQTGYYVANTAAYLLQSPVETRRGFDPSIRLTSDAGIAPSIILAADYRLTGDAGLPQGIIAVSNFALTSQDISNPLSQSYSIVEVVNERNLVSQDFALSVAANDVRVIDSLNLVEYIVVTKINDDFALQVIEDTRVLVSSTPFTPPSGGGNPTGTKNQQTLLFNFLQTCNYGCKRKPKNRTTARPNAMPCRKADCKD